jgi:hypothetical protein
VLWRAWKEVATAEREMLAETTFAALVEAAKGVSESMYYI